MMKIKRVIKDDRGAAQMIEAAILYPIVFVLLFVLIYMGLYIYQSMAVSAYAQKAALLASREVAHPLYMNEVGSNKLNTATVEADLADGQTFNNNMNILQKASDLKRTRAYRYWSSDPISEQADDYAGLLRNMVNVGSLLGTNGSVEVNVTCKNMFIVQYITAEVTQPVVDFPALKFFGIDPPTVSATALAAVNDTDELVRNTDFAVDTISTLAKKLGVDVDGIRSKFDSVKETLGLS